MVLVDFNDIEQDTLQEFGFNYPTLRESRLRYKLFCMRYGIIIKHYSYVGLKHVCNRTDLGINIPVYDMTKLKITKILYLLTIHYHIKKLDNDNEWLILINKPQYIITNDKRKLISYSCKINGILLFKSTKEKNEYFLKLIEDKTDLPSDIIGNICNFI
jgi:hypothetical protein